MKFFISIILIALLSFAVCLYFPWWSIAFVAFLVAALIPQAPAKSFMSGFTAIALLWAGVSIWLSSRNEHLLAHKVSVLILKMDHPFLLITVTAVIGALVAGFAALAASYIWKKNV
jgi:hypothetical protein